MVYCFHIFLVTTNVSIVHKAVRLYPFLLFLIDLCVPRSPSANVNLCTL